MHFFDILLDKNISTAYVTQNATGSWIVQLDDGNVVQVTPEERRPVTEDGEAASTHEPARPLEEEVCILEVCMKRFLSPIPW